jgi:hypothetical protein
MPIPCWKLQNHEKDMVRASQRQIAALRDPIESSYKSIIANDKAAQFKAGMFKSLLMTMHAEKGTESTTECFRGIDLFSFKTCEIGGIRLLLTSSQRRRREA